MKAIFGLGNPGDKYSGNRHNVGFMFLDYLQDKWQLEGFSENKKLKAMISKNEDLLLVKPSTFMNLSGEAVVAVMNFFKLDLKDIVIVFDDIDLPFSKVRYLQKGGPGTHNGMKSIVERLGSKDFARMKIGIENRGDVPVDLSAYVLNDFSDEEFNSLDLIFDNAIRDYFS